MLDTGHSWKRSPQRRSVTSGSACPWTLCLFRPSCSERLEAKPLATSPILRREACRFPLMHLLHACTLPFRAFA